MNLSKEQIDAIQHIKGPALVLAVPGAGKTTVLIHRTANLILNHQIGPDRILSITFSRASARDMKNRFHKLYGDISHIPVHFQLYIVSPIVLLENTLIKIGLDIPLLRIAKGT